MKYNKFLTAILVLLNGLWLSGCLSQAPSMTINSPTNGAVIELSASTHPDPSHDWLHWNPGYLEITVNYPDRAHEWEIQDNGRSILPPDLYTEPNWVEPAPFRWEPANLGIHIITARAAFQDDNSQLHWSDYTSVTVCVINDPVNPVPNIPIGAVGNCLIPPTVTPTPVPIPNPIDSVQAYPNPIYYGDTCPSLTTVTFRTALTLPAGITSDLATVQAHVSVVIGPSETNEGNLLVALLPNGTWDTVTGGQVFLGTLDLSHRYSDSLNHFDPAALGGSPGALLWYLDVSRHDPSFSTETIIGRSANQVLDLSPCPVSGHGPSPHAGGGTPSVCGYTNATSCNLAGCSWNSINSTCSITP